MSISNYNKRFLHTNPSMLYIHTHMSSPYHITFIVYNQYLINANYFIVCLSSSNVQQSSFFNVCISSKQYIPCHVFMQIYICMLNICTMCTIIIIKNSHNSSQLKLCHFSNFCITTQMYMNEKRKYNIKHIKLHRK